MKKLLSTTLTLLLVIGLGTSTLKAEEKKEPKREADTPVTVTFDDKIDVIDPDNPDTDPEEVDPGSDSAIQIWKVPEKLEFKAKRSNKNQVVAFSGENAPTYGVFDFHSESPRWILWAQLEDLKDEHDSEENLVGAKLEWDGVTIQRVTNVTNSENGKESINVNYVEGEKVSLEAGQDLKQVMEAFKGVSPENSGHFEGKMHELRLVIPALQGNPKTDYKGKITWRLQEPVNTEGE